MSKRKGARSPVVILLHEYGFIKVRTGKHEIWKSPGGKTVTISISPGENRTVKNEMSHVKRIAREEGLVR
jgi:predicted RNA binding protein YcfA (HicA-like mRNA interferase family)